MRLTFLLAGLAAHLASTAAAQTTPVLQLGLPGDLVTVSPTAFSSVSTFGDTLLLQAQPSFVPIVAEYTANAPDQLIDLMICGTAFPSFSPIAPSPSGLLEIPLGSAENAAAAAAVMSGDATCSPTTFQGQTRSSGGLRIVSPSDAWDVAPGDLVDASVALSEFSGQWQIVLAFGAPLATWFEMETGEHIGEAIEIWVCDTIVTAPVVQEAIAGGNIVISGSTTKSEAEQQVARINGTLTCAE